jgi:predicted DNA-binding protein with PD1-like motif
MIWKQLQSAPQRTFMLVMEADDEVVERLIEFASEQKIEAAYFSGIGAFREATLAFFDAGGEKYTYRQIPIDEQVEVTSLMGNIGRAKGGTMVHAHACVALPDGSTRGGHLMAGKVRPTLELIVHELPGLLERPEDEETGLPLIRF